MPRKRTGTIQRKGGKLRARVTVTTIDGSTKRIWVDLDANLSDERARSVAEKLAGRLQDRPVSEHQLLALRGGQAVAQSVAEFYEQVYCHVVDLYPYQLSHWRNHILPVLGSESVRTFGVEPLRDLVERLDEKVDSGALAASTASVVWRVAQKFCRDLVRSKRKMLRVRTDNPADNVQGPDAAPATQKQWLYPSELWQFLAAESTPIDLARFVATQVYLCCRPGEAFGLRWEDVDLERRMVRIHQTRDPRTREIGRTKGRDVRSFELPGVLLPMLTRMRAESDGTGFLFRVCPKGADLRAALLTARVDRPELHTTTTASRAMRLHDCRATGLSYLAIQGATDDEIRERAGHRSFTTTLLYVRRGKLAGRVGDPSQPLPSRLGESSTEASFGTETLAKVIPMNGKSAGKDGIGGGSRIQLVYSRTHASQSESDDGDYSEDEFLAALAEHGARAAVADLLSLPLKKAVSK